jgi:hypothetical protein
MPDPARRPARDVDARLSAAAAEIHGLPRNMSDPPELPRRVTLSAVLEKHGRDWQVEVEEHAVYVAVRRPRPSALDVIVAHSVEELARKLDAEPPLPA